MFSIYVLTVVTFLLSWYLLRGSKRPKNFPPGPPGIPIFGNALQLGKYNFKVALALKPKYGDILGVKMGSNWTVFLNNPEDIREAFNKPEYTGRTGFNPLMDMTCEELNSGIIFSYGQKWVDHRRFTLRTLRDFGFAKRTSEERYEYDDPEMTVLMKIFNDFFDSAMDGIRPFYFLFPFLLQIKKPISVLFPEKSDKFRQKLFEFLRKIIDDHRKTMQVGQPRDYIDSMLEESTKTDDLKEIDMLTSLLDFFVAGTETTSTTLLWSCFLLGQHQDIQEKLANEILTTVVNREVTLSDRPSLPYVEATTLEIMRVSSIAPFGTPHATTQDVTYKGFNFPKGTSIIPNIYACLKDADLWGDPDVFRPDRFLSPDGKTVVRNKAWIPFGVGKRSCLGESLARDEIFLFLTNLIQNIRVSMPDDEPPHSLDGLFTGGTLQPEAHRIIINIRN
ncbi:unnamed protein product [Allacma fusca]|uniref:Cytochrome P450 n=1 Tax=Allacma fusca TaxID=39272 RepID=A0A8J2KHU8_9HEXA|nr:unnamed protein product [Allacma fusca]